VSTTEKTNPATLIAFESGKRLQQKTLDWQRQCHAPVKHRTRRDWPDLRAAGLDYADLVDHLLELITAVKGSAGTSTALPAESKGKILPTRLQGRGTNVLQLKLE
jgi:hypothetical protein